MSRQHEHLPTRRSVLRRGAAGVGALALAAVGCDSGTDAGGGATAPAAGSTLRVAATTTMIGDLVRQIGGDRVALKVIIPAGTDPHTFKPSPGDMRELYRAQAVFYNGLHLEGTMIELFEDPAKLRQGRAVAAVAETIPADRLLGWDGGQGGAHDPHVWFDVQLWALAAKAVAATLSKADPPAGADYARRAGELDARLTALDAYAREQIATVPKPRRVLITSHDAYNYFERAYDIEVRGLQGISTESEAGLNAITSAVEFIIARQIPAVFVESSVSPKTIERVQADCRARGFDVKIGGELFSDAMGNPGQHPGYAVETYDGMVRYNVDTVVRALRGG